MHLQKAWVGQMRGEIKGMDYESDSDDDEEEEEEIVQDKKQTK